VRRRASRVVLLLVACALISSCGPGVTRPPRQSGRIVVLGDSLAVSPSDRDNFPAVLESLMRARGLAWSVVNAGVRGDTTAGGIRRIDNLLASNRPDILILALGANDGLRGLDVGDMSRNLSEIILRAQAAQAQVLLCGMQLPPLNVLPYGRRYRAAFADIADEQGVAFVPFLLDGVALDANMNGADGIHPNADGARRIAETIWPYLEPLLSAS
jgi:acyl-CoA thioesterase I